MEQAEVQVGTVEDVEERRSTTLLRAESPAHPVQVVYSDSRVERRSDLAGIILFSIGALFAGLLFSTRYANEANRLVQQSTLMAQETTSFLSSSQLRSEEDARKLMQFGVLSRKGIPVTAIVAQLAQGVSPNITFSKIAVSPARQVRIEGEAKSELAMIQGLARMRKGDAVLNLKLQAFRHPDPAHPLLRFVIAGEAISMEDTKK